jgi:hypothetical protein
MKPCTSTLGRAYVESPTRHGGRSALPTSVNARRIDQLLGWGTSRDAQADSSVNSPGITPSALRVVNWAIVLCWLLLTVTVDGRPRKYALLRSPFGIVELS